MRIPIFQVDAFSSSRFSGNPAAVCVLDAWLSAAQLQAIAAENNLSETAFLVPSDGGYALRWFTPLCEVALCGHATLASAHVLYEELGRPHAEIRFETRQSGVLSVRRTLDGLCMDFPAVPSYPTAAPEGLAAAAGLMGEELRHAGEDLLLVTASPEHVEAAAPDMQALSMIACRGLIVTASGVDCDFVSRFFAPRFGIPEDPVTGSAHCALAPYWAERLGRTMLHARQLSQRGGELRCEIEGDRVRLVGQAVTYLRGDIEI